MCLLIDAIIEQIRRWIKHYRISPAEYAVEDSESTDGHDYVEDIDEDNSHSSNTISGLGGSKKINPVCYKACEGCGQLRHISLVKCRNCGAVIARKALDWKMVKRKAPRSPTYTAKRLFQRIHQLHAAHNRDVVILIFNHSAGRKKGRCYGTPGSANAFLNSKHGKVLRNTWRCYMLKEKLPVISNSAK